MSSEEEAAKAAADAEFGTGIELYRNTVRRVFEAIEGGYIELADAEALVLKALGAAYNAEAIK